MRPTIEPSTPLNEIENRIHRLQAEMAIKNLEAVLIVQNADLFYFTGTIQQSHLYVPVEGTALLMVRKSFERAGLESPLHPVIPLPNSRDLAAVIAEYGHTFPKRLGLELDVLPVNLFRKYQKIFKHAELVDASGLIRRLRSVKSKYEIGLIRKACRLSGQIASYVPTVLRADMREIDLAALIEAKARRLGHHGLTRMRAFNAELFYGQLMSGPAAALPSFLNAPLGGSGMSPALAQSAGQRRIRGNEPVVVDYLFGWQGYLSDHARIYCLGKVSRKMERAHEVMLEVQSLLMERAVPGACCSDLYELACTLVRRKGLGGAFMGATSNRARFVGHGIGLEVDELPVLGRSQDLLLQENMIIALEPKAVFENLGTVGIENMFRVGVNGLDRLTHTDDAIWPVYKQ